MSALDLFCILVFVGGGIAIGGSLAAHWLGHIVGGIVGFLAFVLFSNANARDMARPPRCKCGVKDWHHFKSVKDDNWRFVFRSECGMRYLMRKGRFWFELNDHDEPVLSQIKSLYRDWRDPTEDEIANKRLPTDDVQRHH